MPVDHFNSSDKRTYQNRYWINDVFYLPGGPVIFYDFGETGVSSAYVAELLGEVQNTTTAPVELAKRVNGLIIGWEHRYYGLSLPVPFNTSHGSNASFFTGGLPIQGASGYQYLTVEQALEDVVYFAKNFNPAGYNATLVEALRPSRTPWTWIGGSYPGNRGAWLRIRNPEVFYAVWASSAPVETRVDQAVYYNPIYRAAPRNCSSDIHAVVRYVDGILSSSQDYYIKDLKQRVYASVATLSNATAVWNTSFAADLSPFEIAQYLSYPIGEDFQDGGPSRSIDMFCNYMQSYNPAVQPTPISPTDATVNITAYMRNVFTNPGNNTPEDSGIVSRYGVDTGLNAYLYASRLYQYNFASSIRSEYKLINIAPDASIDGHSWRWQTLTEVGYFQGSQPQRSINLLSKYQNSTSLRDYYLNFQFGSYNRDVFPAEPNVDVVNRYGGWDMRPSNVMFTNGEFDPWRSLSVASIEESIGAPMRKTVQDIPECGRPPNGTDVFGVIYPGAAHAFDLAKEFVNEPEVGSPVDIGVDLFARALEQWLPCFIGQSS